MSEKLNPEVDNTLDDDPLAELARIVAGESEPVLETNEVDPGNAVEAEPAISDMDMEAALSDVLDDAFEPTAEVGTPEAYAEPELSVREEMNRAVEQVVNEEPVSDFHADDLSAQIEPAPEFAQASAYEAPQVSEAPAGSEGSFEDGLLSALENELTGAPEAAPFADMQVEEASLQEAWEASEPGAQVNELNVEVSNPDVDALPEMDSLEDMLSAELEAASSEVMQEASTPLPTPPAAETYVPENQVDPLPPHHDDIAHDAYADASAQGDMEVASVDEDLGAAFANEFEQMLAQDETHAQPAEVGVEPVVEQAQPLVEEAVTPAAESPRSLDELDFGSAFAEELGVESVDEVSGWDASTTQAAQAEFAEAIQSPEMQMDYEDPGHAGALPGMVDQTAHYAELEVKKSGSSMKYTLAALIIALFAGTIFAGYGFLGEGDGAGADGEPQLIKAETDVIKEKPEDPGGRVVANQDKASYEKVEGGDSDVVEQESLISNTEEPAEIVSTGVNDGTVLETNLAEKTDDRLAVSEEPAPTTGSATANGEVAPRVVQTVTVKPDGTIVPAAPSVPKIAETVTGAATELASNTLNSVGEAATNLTETIRVEPKPVATELIKRPEPIDGAKTTGNTAVPEASPLPKPKPVVQQKPKPVQTAAVKPKPAAPAAVRRSEWVVQVSSQRTPEAAQASFTNLRNRFGVLQGRPMSVQRANVNGATFYRVRVQTSSQSDANQLCNRLKSAGGSCFVTR